MEMTTSNTKLRHVKHNTTHVINKRCRHNEKPSGTITRVDMTSEHCRSFILLGGRHTLHVLHAVIDSFSFIIPIRVDLIYIIIYRVLCHCRICSIIGIGLFYPRAPVGAHHHSQLVQTAMNQ